MRIFSRLTTDISLEDAVRSGKLEVVRKILRRGVGQEELNNCLGYSQHESLKMLKLLVKHGADINYQSSDGGKRPLHLAAINGRPELAIYLIEQGAFVNAVDEDGYTALDHTYKTPLDEVIFGLGGESAEPFIDTSKKLRLFVAEVLTLNGGIRGHTKN